MELERVGPGTAALLWRLGGVILLAGLWLGAPRGEAGLVLILVLLVMALARWRFALPPWTAFVDQAACTAALSLSLWPEAAFGLALPIFDCCAAARPAYALPSLLALFLLCAWSLPVAAALAVGTPAGLGVELWRRQVAAARLEADRDRRERYELESLKGEHLAANVRVSRMAQEAERARIARDLHDHAGHEITAAALALQAFRRLWEEGDLEAPEMLGEAERRVADGMELLRSTVRGMSPRSAPGVDTLRDTCRRYAAGEVSFVVHGDTQVVPAHAWSVLEPCLKEALTNAARHQGAGRVEVSLDVGPHNVRLSVHSQTRARPGDGRGLGLESLAQRARAVGGSISTDARDGFRLVCVLPLGEEAE